MEAEQLIDLILEKFHKKHREDLEMLIPLARKVESDQVRGGNYNYEGIGLPDDLK